jgi:hypothetical protein
MKLFILRPVAGLPDNDNPWEPWYDKVFGFVVRAHDEPAARLLAQANAADEKKGTFLGAKTANTISPWLDPK